MRAHGIIFFKLYKSNCIYASIYSMKNQSIRQFWKRTFFIFRTSKANIPKSSLESRAFYGSIINSQVDLVCQSVCLFVFGHSSSPKFLFVPTVKLFYLLLFIPIVLGDGHTIHNLSVPPSHQNIGKNKNFRDKHLWNLFHACHNGFHMKLLESFSGLLTADN